MFNLIKMDIYRLLHSVSTWVIMAFVVAFSVFFVMMTNIDLKSGKPEVNSSVTQESSDRQIGIYVEADPKWYTGKIEIGSLIGTEMGSGLLAMLCIIFAAIFSNADQKNGYIKNIAGLFHERGKLILSKFIVIAVEVFTMLVIFSIVTIISGYFLWGNSLYVGSFATLFKLLGTQYLLHLGFASIVMLLCVLTCNTAFGMTTGIIATAGLLVPFYALINKLVSEILPKAKFDINKFMLDGNIISLNIYSNSNALLRGAAVGSVFICLAVILSIIIMKKRDIRYAS